MLSLCPTQHDHGEVSEYQDKKPQVILNYNKYKGGVDEVASMLDVYPMKSGCCCWSMVIFTTLLDITCVNAFAVWIKNYPD